MGFQIHILSLGQRWCGHMKVPTVISGFTCRMVGQILVYAYFSNHFAHSSPELLCMLHVVVPEHKGGVNEIRSGHRLVFFASHGFMHCWLRIFWQQFKIVFDASILRKRDGFKTHEGALQFISGRFGLNFGIQNFHL